MNREREKEIGGDGTRRQKYFQRYYRKLMNFKLFPCGVKA